MYHKGVFIGHVIETEQDLLEHSYPHLAILNKFSTPVEPVKPVKAAATAAPTKTEAVKAPKPPKSPKKDKRVVSKPELHIPDFLIEPSIPEPVTEPELVMEPEVSEDPVKDQ